MDIPVAVGRNNCSILGAYSLASPSCCKNSYFRQGLTDTKDAQMQLLKNA
jgi:hypothetical protein